MGKREYQTKGKGDFSFPVTSLRENLILTLYDTEGNEISRTGYVKTMLVVEKRFWDALFPLEGGGFVHLKLQFLLSEEERKRIREMRESVLKRKHDEQLKSSFKHSISALTVTEETIGSSTPHPITELRGGGLADHHLALTAPVKDSFSMRPLVSSNSKGKLAVCDESGKLPVTPLLQEPQEQPEHSSEWHFLHLSEINKETSVTQLPLNDVHEIHASLEEALDPQSGLSGSLVSGNLASTFSSPSAQSEEDRTHSRKKNVLEKIPVSNVKKMISAFESSSFQGPGSHVGSTTKPQFKKIEMEGSLRGTLLEETNTKNVEVGKMMSKSFSAGMLSEINSQHLNFNYEKKPEEEFSRETVGNIKQFIESDNYRNHKNLDPGKQKSVNRFLYAPQSPSCEKANDVVELIENGEMANLGVSADIVGERQQCSSRLLKEGSTITSQKREHEPFEEEIVLDSFSEGGYSLKSQISDGTSNVTFSSCSGEGLEMLGSEHNLVCKINKRRDRIVEDHGAHGQLLGDYLQSFNGIELVHTNDLRQEEGAFMEDARLSAQMVDEPANIEQPCSSSMYQKQSALSAIRAESGRSSCKDDYDELTVCGTSNEKLDVVAYFGAEHCLLGSHGSWTQRHLCITTGSRQLKDLIEDFNVHIGISVDKSLTTMNAAEGFVARDETGIDVLKDEKMSCSSRNSNPKISVGTSKMGLMEQVARIVILLAACGAFLLNTRRKKT